MARATPRLQYGGRMLAAVLKAKGHTWEITPIDWWLSWKPSTMR